MIPLRFTADDAQRAHDEWGANCGPAAIAAVLGMTLDELRPHLGDFENKRYTNPSLMWETLCRLKATWRLRPRDMIGWPNYGLARVQWEGPWTKPGVPARVAYRHTHWVAAEWSSSTHTWAVFDINAMNSGGWIALADWRDSLVPWLLKECEPRASGEWRITHSVEVEPPEPSDG